MDKNKTEDIIKNYEKTEKKFVKTEKNMDYLNKMKDIKDAQVELNRLSLHIERLGEEKDNISDFQVKEECQKQIENTEKEIESKREEIEKLEKEKEAMLIEKKKNEKALREKIYREVNDLQDKTRKDLMQEKKMTETEIAKKKMELEVKNFEISQFTYKYDENGVPTNGEDFRKLQEEEQSLFKEIKELEEISKKCETYKQKLINPFKMPPELPDDEIYVGFQKENKEEIIDEINQEKADGNVKGVDQSTVSTHNRDENEQTQNSTVDDISSKKESSKENVPEEKFEIVKVDSNVKGVKQPPILTNNNDKKIANEKDQSENKIIYIGIFEEDGTVYYEDEKGNKDNISIGEVLEYKKAQFKRLDINKICREVAGGWIKGKMLGRKVNPQIVNALQKNPEQLKEYITSLKDKKEFSFELVHNLEGISLWEKFKLNKFARAEQQSGGKVIGKLFDKNDALNQGKEKELIEATSETYKKGVDIAKENSAKLKEGVKNFVPKINNEDSHIEKNAQMAVKETQEKMAKEIAEINRDEESQK